ncbi:hypothetical protein GCM10028820_22780 [Tessaracoccus terricola]
MIDLSLALQLRDAGLAWRPAPGDRFIVTATEMIDDLLFLSDMVIQPRELETGTIFAFNGTTEWALDSVAQERTVWLPHEGQLRAALGDAFRSLTRSAGYTVAILVGGAELEFHDHDPENAYAKALLAALEHRAPAP